LLILQYFTILSSSSIDLRQVSQNNLLDSFITNYLYSYLYYYL